MSKGENIFKRKDGRWEARYIKERDASGKIKYGFCYGKTYKEAKEKVARRRVDLLNGCSVSASTSGRRFGYYCDEWLWISRNRLKESTYVKYETILRLHIKPVLGNYLPSGITSVVIQEFSERLIHKSGLAPKTAKDILTVLRSVLKYISRQVPGNAPSIEMNYPHVPTREMRVLRYEEQQRLMLYLSEDMDPCKFGTLLAMMTGLRIGEVCALRWENISLTDRTICVHSTMQRLKNNGENSTEKTKVIISPPKSNKSFRIIPLTAYTAALCDRMNPHCPDAYILTGNTKFMEPRALQYRFGKYTRDCGLEGVHFHTLRHTFATRCVEVGFEIKSLSDILGHASTEITLERYVHSSLELKRVNMDKLSAAGW